MILMLSMSAPLTSEVPLRALAVVFEGEVGSFGPLDTRAFFFGTSLLMKGRSVMGLRSGLESKNSMALSRSSE